MGLKNGEEFMNYKTDYFKPENINLYPLLTLDEEEYLIFMNKCEYILQRTKGIYWPLSFPQLKESNRHESIVMDDQIMSMFMGINEIKIVEKFYYKTNIKYLEEKINELIWEVHDKNKHIATRLDNLTVQPIHYPPLPPYVPSLWPCIECQNYHCNNHQPVITYNPFDGAL